MKGVKLERYYIIDLERTLYNSSVHYRRRNRCGYTIEKVEAGVFSYIEARKICLSDVECKTVMIPIS